jgi:anhydro-N-acetylmuramic acid kinase
MIILGIMNGTSGDGIDYVWVDLHFDKKLSVKFLKHLHRPFSKSMHESIKKAALNQLLTYDLGELHHELGRQYARDYASFKVSAKLKPHIIGLHGQTVFHHGGVATLQIGEPSYLAQAAHCPVIFNFRAADIVTGGQGAPLAPVFHKVLLSDLSKNPVAFHNLGGISNVTYCHKDRLLAFDTGPACTLMDSWMQLKSKEAQKFDKDGKGAARGLPHLDSLKKFMGHPYFAKKPPKSCGREEFNLDFIKERADKRFFRLSLEDQLATLTEFTAQSIFSTYEKWLPEMPETIFFSGGGSKNKFLMQRLKIYFKDSSVQTSEDLGWPSEAIEGGAFAVLAYLRLYEQHLDLKNITGGKRPVLLGQICE